MLMIRKGLILGACRAKDVLETDLIEAAKQWRASPETVMEEIR